MGTNETQWDPTGPNTTPRDPQLSPCRVPPPAGLRALRVGGGGLHHPAGEAAPHHHLPPRAAARVPGEAPRPSPPVSPPLCPPPHLTGVPSPLSPQEFDPAGLSQLLAATAGRAEGPLRADTPRYLLRQLGRARGGRTGTAGTGGGDGREGTKMEGTGVRGQKWRDRCEGTKMGGTNMEETGVRGQLWSGWFGTWWGHRQV